MGGLFNRLFAFIGQLVSENGSASMMRWQNLMTTVTGCIIALGYTFVLLSQTVPQDFPTGASVFILALFGINYTAKVMQKKEEEKEIPTGDKTAPVQ